MFDALCVFTVVQVVMPGRVVRKREGKGYSGSGKYLVKSRFCSLLLQITKNHTFVCIGTKHITMSNEQLKYSISHLLDEIEDTELLNSIYVLLKHTQPVEDIVGYEVDGSAISEEELIASILEDRPGIAAGQVISFEDMKKELGL